MQLLCSPLSHESKVEGRNHLAGILNLGVRSQTPNYRRMMESLPVYFHPEAITEASAATQWYRERSSAAAKAFISELDRIVGKIIMTPEIYPLYVGDTRHALLHRFPFSVVYREASGRIEVIAIAHGRRKPGYWKYRLI
jgi:plasmid stabilization system protein ParE